MAERMAEKMAEAKKMAAKMAPPKAEKKAEKKPAKKTAKKPVWRRLLNGAILLRIAGFGVALGRLRRHHLLCGALLLPGLDRLPLALLGSPLAILGMLLPSSLGGLRIASLGKLLTGGKYRIKVRNG